MIHKFKIWWAGVGVALALSVFAFLSYVKMAAPKTVLAASADGHFTLRVTIGKRIPIEIVDNRQGASVPLRLTNAVNDLLHQANNATLASWDTDNKTCSVLIETDNTRLDRIVWMKVSGASPTAQVTSLEAVDD